MTTPIKIKRSGTASSTPSSLDHGELAINYADDTLFWKDSSNVIQSFVFQAYASTTHASTHATGGSDALAPGDIGAAPAASPTFTGVITVSATSGSAGSYAPSLTFSGDQNTGFGQVSGQSDTASVFTAGQERVRVDASGRVGIGTGSSTPAGRLEIRNDVTSGNANVRFTNGLNWGYGVQVEFAQPTSNGAAIAQTGAIINGWDSDDNFSLRFRTMAAGTVAERLRVKSTGAVRFVPLAADPASGEAGDVYYNSTTNKLRVYNGTSWVDLH